MTDTSNNEPIQRRAFVGRAASVVGASSLLGASALSAEDGGTQAEYCGKPQRAALEARLIARAWSDPSYAERLKRDPKGMLAQELRHDIPRDLDIEVIEETRDRIVLVIPVNPNEFSEKRLSEGELIAVASGIRFDTPCVTVASGMPVWFQQLEYFPRSRDIR